MLNILLNSLWSVMHKDRLYGICILEEVAFVFLHMCF